jgi:glycosyltransferase A (GT-A) superfamily protein (DUF2064 family)
MTHSTIATERSRNENLLLIGARAPVPGACKTRLGASIGMEAAAELYRAFLVDLAARFTGDPGWAARNYDVAWAYTPEIDFAAVLRACGCSEPLSPVGFVLQEGDGWGVRQANLLRWGATHDYDRTVLVASDAPHLSRDVVEQAFALLETRDVVVGRSLDGGYSLIGIRGYHDVLSGVPMSTSSAGDALVASARSLGLRVGETTTIFDVDEAADLDLLTGTLAPNGAAAPATWAALRSLGLLPEVIPPQREL